MRCHSSIIDEANGATALASKLHGRPGYERWETVKDLANTIQGWKRTNSIPPEYWADLVDLKVAGHEELAEHARRHKLFRGAATPEQPAA